MGAEDPSSWLTPSRVPFKPPPRIGREYLGLEFDWVQRGVGGGGLAGGRVQTAQKTMGGYSTALENRQGNKVGLDFDWVSQCPGFRPQREQQPNLSGGGVGGLGGEDESHVVFRGIFYPCLGEMMIAD